MNDTRSNTAVATRKTFSGFVSGEGMKRKINEIIGSKKGDGFVTAIVSAVSMNPALAECDNNTILSAGLQGAALDLSPSPGDGLWQLQMQRTLVPELKGMNAASQALAAIARQHGGDYDGWSAIPPE